MMNTSRFLYKQIRTKFRKPDIELVLFQDVEGLGTAGEIVKTSRGYARNFLVPQKQAYYLPRKLGKPILPPNFKFAEKFEAEEHVEIVPAFMEVEYFEAQSVNNPAHEDTRATIKSSHPVFNQAINPMPETQKQDVSDAIFSSMVFNETDKENFDYHEKLKNVKNLMFKRVKVNENGLKIFGSVTSQDIYNSLKEHYGILVDSQNISINNGNKIKEVGTYQASVTLPEKDPIEISIEVVDSVL